MIEPSQSVLKVPSKLTVRLEIEDLNDARGVVMEGIVGRYSYFSHFNDARYCGRPNVELEVDVHEVTNWTVIL